MFLGFFLLSPGIHPLVIRKHLTAAAAAQHIHLSDEVWSKGLLAPLRQMKWDNMSGMFLECIGRVLAVDSNGTFDAEITADKIMTADTRLNKFGVEPNFSAILDQMLLVFAQSRTNTIRWGTAIVPLLRMMHPDLEYKWSEQIRTAERAASILVGSDYVGLQEYVPSGMEVCSMPSLCYIGVLWCQKNLPNAQNFPLERVANKLDSRERKVCEIYGKNLPKPNQAVVTKMLRTVAPAFWQDLLRPFSKTDRDAIYQELAADPQPCAWYRAEKKMREG